MAYFGVHLFVFFVCRFLKMGQMMISVCLYCFFGFKIVCLSTMQIVCQIPSRNSCPDQIKGFFVCFCSIESGRWCQHVCFGFFVSFLSFWLFGSKLILLDWRLQDYYGNFGKVSSRQGLQSYHKSFFEWIIWWWS